MVYFIISKTDNLVKIGYSANPQRRFKLDKGRLIP